MDPPTSPARAYGILGHVGIFSSPLCDDGRPSDTLSSRLDYAVELYRAQHFDTFILSGGERRNNISEARAMEQYLQRHHGIGPSHTIREPSGTDTLDSLRFMRKMEEDERYGLRVTGLVTGRCQAIRTKLLAHQVFGRAIPVAYPEPHGLDTVGDVAQLTLVESPSLLNDWRRLLAMRLQGGA